MGPTRLRKILESKPRCYALRTNVRPDGGRGLENIHPADGRRGGFSRSQDGTGDPSHSSSAEDRGSAHFVCFCVRALKLLEQWQSRAGLEFTADDLGRDWSYPKQRHHVADDHWREDPLAASCEPEKAHVHSAAAGSFCQDGCGSPNIWCHKCVPTLKLD